MKYSKAELIEMENPYESLIKKDNGVSLIESRDAINELSGKDRRALVTKIALNCPTSGFSDLNKVIHRSLVCNEFSAAIGRVCILNRLATNLNGSTPHLVFADRDFNISFFHEFPELVAKLVPNMKALSEKMATAASGQYSMIARQLALIFSESLVKQDDDCTNQFGAIVEEQQRSIQRSPSRERNSMFASISEDETTTLSEESKTEITYN
ncbi:hypothetical protein [Legionella hackeliae]|uniref:Uncharacterized protein n=1 Tax=Legionella hackeliae TaxID=449 RepID=A0A0A8UKC6_LEGHA|nr:hypothetical protein [Legionella hackeliae]KTD12830.1 hypothetical protein Lhac_1701 [Legionella hackeliae]CEK09133.1 protein of unknown function [Legionella hackeliae]STX49043.1 Uncharacterised protein [Legionella hackeliae]